MTIKSESQKLEPSAIVEMYVIDTTEQGGTIDRYYDGLNELGNNLVWTGDTYINLPITASGFSQASSGTLPRPVLGITNQGGLMAALARQHNDFTGAKVTRIRTFARFLDAVNFADGNLEADPNAKLPDDVFYVDRKASEDPEYITFELASASDLEGVKLPRRRVVRTCAFEYRGEGCGYSGAAVANYKDQATTDINQDQCSRKISGCQLRFSGTLPFGGFPNVGR